MFEKDAEEYADEKCGTIETEEKKFCRLDWQKGAEFGYNKANDRLTKAKEIIRQFLNDYPVITKELLDKLEQFINGENTILEDAQASNSPFDADKVFNKEMKAYTEEEVKKEIEKCLD